MPFPLFPKLITEELTDLTADALKERGIRLLMMDFDNTIDPYTTSTPTEKRQNLIRARSFQLESLRYSSALRNKVFIGILLLCGFVFAEICGIIIIAYNIKR